MSFNEFESSFFNATPERLFLFEMALTRWAYVASTEEVVRLGVTYSPMPVEMEELTQSLTEDAQIIQVRIASTAAVVSQFVAYQPTEPLRLRVFRHHFDDPDGEFRTEVIGEVVSSSFDEAEKVCTLSVRMITHEMDRMVPWMSYQKPCNHPLYSVGCGVSKVAFRVVPATVAQNGSVLTAGEFDGYDDGWFNAGFVETSKGERRFIVKHVGTDITLITPLINFAPGDDVLFAYAGCDLKKTTCETKFNNLPNYMGFMWVGDKNPFTDNVYGTGAALGSSGSKTNWRKAINPAGWNGSWGLF